MKTNGLALCLVATSALLIATPSAVAKVKYTAETMALNAVMGEEPYNFSMGETRFVVASAELAQSESDLKNEMPKAKGPAIWIMNGDKTTVVDLRKAFANRYAEKVFTGDDGKSAWILLEWGVEGPTGELLVLKTADAGQTWSTLAELKKPPFKFPYSSLKTFFIDKKGNGKAVFLRDRSDAGPKIDPEEVYVVTTTNAGRSWNYPKTPWAKNSLTEISRSKN